MVTTWHIRKKGWSSPRGSDGCDGQALSCRVVCSMPETPISGWDGLKFGYPLVPKAAIFSICPFNEVFKNDENQQS